MNDDVMEKPSLDSLLDQNLHDLINCTASKFFREYGKYNSHSTMITQEDLAQQGFFGVMTAYKSFDLSLRYDDNIISWFRAHAYLYIRSAMLTYCRKFSHSLSISEKAARDDWKSMTNIGVIHIDQLNDDKEFDIPMGSGIDNSQDVDEYFFTGFTQLECDLIKDNIIDGYSLQELADKYNISKSRSGEIIRELIDRMRMRAENYEQNN